MSIASLLIASLIGAVATTALSNVPYLNTVNCLLCAGFWVGAILATWIYKRQTDSLTLRQGVVIGALTGLITWAFGFLLSLARMADPVGLVKSYGLAFAGDPNPDIASPEAWKVTLVNSLGDMVNILFEAISGVNSYWLRGYGDPAPQTVIVLGEDASHAFYYFKRCDYAGRITNRYGVMNEETREHSTILICRGIRRSWQEMWKTILHFG